MNNLEILKKRKSVRTYSDVPIEKELAEKLKAEVTLINTHVHGLNFQLVFNDPSPFKGFFKSYGSFKNASNYLAAIIDDNIEGMWEKAGYYAEKFVIEAVKNGLGTCFVGGTYDPKSVNLFLRFGEKILFLVLFGYPLEKERFTEKLLVNFIHRKIMNPEDFFEPSGEYESAIKRFPKLKEGLEAVACAPSSLNKRPTRLFIKDIDGRSEICAKVDSSNNKAMIDLGIAKFNFNYATSTQCEWGNGEPVISKD